MTRSSIRPAVLALSLALGAGAAHAAAPAQEFIKGVDISTVQALEDKGITFSDGGKTGDLLAILKAHGVNYVRLRVWNRPTESGGYNDRAKLLKLAPRVKAAGLKLLVDFHYSDFWADPGKQVKPAAWRGLSGMKLQQAVYDYTKDVLTGLKAVNAYPDMVQIGNEINSGMLLPDGAVANFDGLAGLLKAGVKAVRDTTPVGPRTKVMLHLAEGGDNSVFVHFFDQVKARGIDYDVIGLSYYPYWHGTFGQLKANLNDLAKRYGRELVVAETAYPYTLANGDASAGNIAGQEQTDTVGLPASVANQKLVVQTVLNTVASVPGGLGLGAFYWEPAWLPGVGWKTGETNSWENQAMFDFKGAALDSLDAFRFTPSSVGTASPVAVLAPAPVMVAKGATPILPAQVNVLYNEGTIKSMLVQWSAVSTTTPGAATVPGTGAGLPQKAALTVNVTAPVPTQTNLVQNPGFEDDLAHWTLGGTDAGKIDGKAGNAHGGAKAFNYWYGTPFAYTLTQKLTGLKDGTYTLRAWASGVGGDTKAALTAQGAGGAQSTPITNTGWNVWKPYAVENITVTGGTLTIGFDVAALGAIWGFFDDVELVPVAGK
ncbi:glycosyl hydrolase 53 family protein [Deinococcus sp.]|uniref:glycosyl hydrolase 53 family protein n=1 Tax=Deinococcus sp. TaxID=47478 RepID=UPI002869BFE0|nr:glycosyl hydrolase 53 family protein [Deinococcus sp.]